MATTRLSDILDIVVYQDLPQIVGPEKTAFFESGIVTRNPMLDAIAAQAGKTAELPYWNDLDGSEEVNYSSDNPDSDASPSKITQGEQVARKAFVNKGWSATDLASELAMGPRAMEAIRSATGRYFMRQWQRRLVAAVTGVQANNVESNDSDMVHDVAVEVEADQTSASRFSRANFIRAAYTMGDAVDGVEAVGVHSAVKQQMVEQDDVEDVRDADGRLLFQAYMGRRIIVDDGFPVIAGATSGLKYLTVLFGPGALGWGAGSPEVPVEIYRNPQGGDGGGIEELWERNTWILHPFGYKQIGTPGGTPARQSFNQAELKTAAVWERQLERKLVPMAFLITN